MAGAGVAAGAWALRSFGRAEAEYAQAVREIWRHAAVEAAAPPALLRELVRYATLAPSSHNTQCWKFIPGKGSVSVLPDYGRRCPAVDPDDHHLFASLGCAAENLVQAAAATGYRGEAAFSPGTREVLHIALSPAKAVKSPLFEAIPLRQSTRAEFDGRPLSTEEQGLLEAAGTGPGVSVRLLTGRAAMERVLEFVVAGNSAQIPDPAFVRELGDWIRFNPAHALATRDGLFSGASGNRSVPTWLGRTMFGAVFTEASENDKYARYLRTSAGIVVFVSEADNKTHWIEAGRAFQRFALQAAALGIRTAHLNQPLEVASLRSQFADWLGVARGRPDLAVRFGRGPEMPRSLRRPVEAVLALAG